MAGSLADAPMKRFDTDADDVSTTWSVG